MLLLSALFAFHEATRLQQHQAQFGGHGLFEVTLSPRGSPLPFFPLFLIAKVQFALQVSLQAKPEASCGFIVRWLPDESVGSNRLGLLLDQLKGRR